jgi:hypothetical protein
VAQWTSHQKQKTRVRIPPGYKILGKFSNGVVYNRLHLCVEKNEIKALAPPPQKKISIDAVVHLQVMPLFGATQDAIQILSDTINSDRYVNVQVEFTEMKRAWS